MAAFRAAALLSLLAVGALTAPARAELIVTANGVTEADSASNTSVAVTTSIGSFNIVDVDVAGAEAFGTSGELLDVGTLDISSTGSGTLTLLVTETGLSASDAAELSILLSALVSDANVEISYYLDPTDSGQLTDLLVSTDSTTGSFVASDDLTSPFSLTEEIVITATGSGAVLSADDSVTAVNEPGSLALLGAGFIGCGMIGRTGAGRTRLKQLRERLLRLPSAI